MVTKALGFIIKKILPWETIISFIIQLAAGLLKDWLKDAEFTKKAKYFTMGVYVFAEGLGEELAKDTKTPLDDETVQEVLSSCETASLAHDFKLPEIEELS